MNKNIFRKAMTIVASTAMVGMTIGAAAAASYPSGFTSDTAVVVGASASADTAAAGRVLSGLNSASSASTSLSGAEGETEDEIGLGGTIISGKVKGTLTDSDIPSLLDTKISWDDGGASGSDDYNYHESIVINTAKMHINTTLDDNDYAENLVLSNDKGLEYRFIFDDAFNVTGVGATGADDLYLTLLGTSYEVSAMTNTSITVVTSEETRLAIGESYTVDGETFTVDDIFSGSIQVNGESITEGSSKKIGTKKVEVTTIGYHTNSPELSSVLVKIGDDISKTYTDGEEYIGEDEDDPLWVWTISNPSVAAGYVGVKYNQKETRDTDDVVYIGGSYILPEDFGAVQFDGTTKNIAYEDFTVSFLESEDLWNATQVTSTANTLDSPVIMIEANDDTKDAISMFNDTTKETSAIYLRWTDNASETEFVSTSGGVEVFYKDVNGDVEDAQRIRIDTIIQSTGAVGVVGTIAASPVANIIVGDTNINISVTVTAGNMHLNFTDAGAIQQFALDIGGDGALNPSGNNNTGNLKWLGANVEATDKEDSLAGDIMVGTTSVGTYDNDIMTKQGIIIATPEANGDNDELRFSVPDDRVYAIVSVVAGGTATTTDSGIMSITDAEISSASGKNLVVVGGSAINSVAADLLGGEYREAAFTSATGVGAGQFLIQAFDWNGNTALLVAGYEAADTSKAVDYLLNNDVDTGVGMVMKKQTSNFANIV